MNNKEGWEEYREASGILKQRTTCQDFISLLVSTSLGGFYFLPLHTSFLHLAVNGAVDVLLRNFPFYNFFHQEDINCFFPRSFQSTVEELWLAVSGDCWVLLQSVVTRGAGSCKNRPAPIIISDWSWEESSNFQNKGGNVCARRWR